MASDLSKLGLLIIQIHGLHRQRRFEVATENSVVVQALIDNLIEGACGGTVIRSGKLGSAQASLAVITGYGSVRAQSRSDDACLDLVDGKR
jgi:hypothetical protein